MNCNALLHLERKQAIDNLVTYWIPIEETKQRMKRLLFLCNKKLERIVESAGFAAPEALCKVTGQPVIRA